VLAVLVTAVSLSVPAATASPHMLVGLLDEANTLYGNPDRNFPILKQLRVQVLRVNLYWGGRFGVANEKPTDATDPADPAYDWSIYDRTVNYAAQYGVKMLFSIYGTPRWANKGKGLRYAPAKPSDLQKFAYAAAQRYSGTFEGEDGRNLPPVRLWTAWNEPNNPIQLSPQYRKVGGKWVIQSAIDYAKICNAVYTGVHSSMISSEKVACGVTSPRGNNAPATSRPSVSPLAFLRACKKAGLKRFDAWAHHPYYGKKTESPTYKPGATAVQLGNIDALVSEVTRLYGAKRIWITEYAYQTDPPDKLFGVSYAKQAAYLTQAYAIARRNPRIDMMLWFMLRDDTSPFGWQSGFFTASGKKKPAFAAFQSLPH
jgi:hypothetical protein